MIPRLSRSQGRLVRALGTYLATWGELSMRRDGSTHGMVLESIHSEPWTSLTFAGERHRVVVRVPAAATNPIDASALAVPGAIIAIERAAWDTVDGAARLTLDALAIAGGF